ncbi:hypothetical protein PAMC26510_33190 [Caballeronia sordidicola]|uniref:Uncharacterized protein n=1 Tax=Caballeronia sordidicola TaxID=196367 RepID=A0A242M6H1_CABSO|nr:hypothetical protein PAMC26510_33190 [Caballeronia sordidicola]
MLLLHIDLRCFTVFRGREDNTRLRVFTRLPSVDRRLRDASQPRCARPHCHKPKSP